MIGYIKDRFGAALQAAARWMQRAGSALRAGGPGEEA